MKDKDIIFYQFTKNKDTQSINEIIPEFKLSLPEKIFSLDSSGSIFITNLPTPSELEEGKNISLKNIDGKIIIDTSINFIIDDKFINTEIFYKDNRIGLGRIPLHSYKVDIAVPTNTLMTAFHVGDGKYGFSMGNGTSQGFIPEIIGMGSDENDAGLYFIGKSGNNIESDIPLIIMDGRSISNTPINNRPLFGITNGNYNKYKIIVDSQGKMGIGKVPEKHLLEVNGSIQANDFIIDNLSIRDLIEVIKEHQEEIDRLNSIIKQLL